MTKLITSGLLAVFLCACVSAPNLETGEGCWRYGVATDNTGPLSSTPLDQIPVVRLNYADLAAACDRRLPPVSWHSKGTMLLRSCYQHKTDTIYLHYYAGKMDLYREQCRILLGPNTNQCRGYGIGQDESACEWQAIADQNAVSQERSRRHRRNN